MINQITESCISFDSYIKPQRLRLCCRFLAVVYLLIPTSNHNGSAIAPNALPLYIFWFLHQTTTPTFRCYLIICCISFDSYIKPQRCVCLPEQLLVVYLLIPTSNHNFDVCSRLLDYVVYLLIPTSNHNPPVRLMPEIWVYIFWFLHQTTNQILV